jgi:polyphosphate glucokinase
LCIDIGGTGIKALILDATGRAMTDRVRMKTPRPATPRAVFNTLVELVTPLGTFDRIAVGFPGVVMDGVIKTAPNLHHTWADFPMAAELQRKFGKRARVLNDAGMQGYAVIEGRGLEMVLTLGTGFGCALFIDGHYVPNLELAHHPFQDDVTYEEYVGAVAYEAVGNRKWNARVRRVLGQVQPIFNPRKIYLGGGNAKHLHSKLPPNVEITENIAGLFGGIALWRTAEQPGSLRKRLLPRTPA